MSPIQGSINASACTESMKYASIIHSPQPKRPLKRSFCDESDNDNENHNKRQRRFLFFEDIPEPITRCRFKSYPSPMDQPTRQSETPQCDDDTDFPCAQCGLTVQLLSSPPSPTTAIDSCPDCPLSPTFSETSDTWTVVSEDPEYWKRINDPQIRLTTTNEALQDPITQAEETLGGRRASPGIPDEQAETDDRIDGEGHPFERCFRFGSTGPGRYFANYHENLSSSQKGKMRASDLSSDSMPITMGYLPIFTIQFKSSPRNGRTWVAEDQAVNDGALCVNSVGRLFRLIDEYPDQIDTIAFSCVIDERDVPFWLQCCNRELDEFCSVEIDSFWVGTGSDIKATRTRIGNLNAGVLKDRLSKVLDALLQLNPHFVNDLTRRAGDSQS